MRARCTIHTKREIEYKNRHYGCLCVNVEPEECDSIFFSTGYDLGLNTKQARKVAAWILARCDEIEQEGE